MKLWTVLLLTVLETNLTVSAKSKSLQTLTLNKRKNYSFLLIFVESDKLKIALKSNQLQSAQILILKTI